MFKKVLPFIIFLFSFLLSQENIYSNTVTPTKKRCLHKEKCTYNIQINSNQPNIFSFLSNDIEDNDQLKKDAVTFLQCLVCFNNNDLKNLNNLQIQFLSFISTEKKFKRQSVFRI